jgi:hypothetical protein
VVENVTQNFCYKSLKGTEDLGDLNVGTVFKRNNDFEDMMTIRLADDKAQWPVVVKTIKNIPVP